MSLVQYISNGAKVQTIEDLGRFGNMAMQSGLFKDIRSAAAAAVKIQRGLELGLQPIESLNSFHVVEGKIVMAAQLMGALVKRAGYSYKVVRCDSTACTLSWKDPKGEQLGEVSFTIEDAKRAGLAGRGAWAKHPDDMLFKTCISKGARRFAPEVLLGCYAQEEWGSEEEEPAIKDDYADIQHLQSMLDDMKEKRLREAPIVTGGSEREKADRTLYLAEKGEPVAIAEALAVAYHTEEDREAWKQRNGAEEQAEAPEHETEDCKRASKRLHAVMREHFWNKDQIKQWMGVESTKDLDAQTLDAVAVILSCFNLEQLKNVWANFPATVRATLTPLKDALKSTLENQTHAGDIANAIRAIKESECPHKLVPANLRQLDGELLEHLAGILRAAHADPIRSAVDFMGKAAERGANEKMRQAARNVLDVCESATVWKLERLGKQ